MGNGRYPLAAFESGTLAISQRPRRSTVVTHCQPGAIIRGKDKERVRNESEHGCQDTGRSSRDRPAPAHASQAIHRDRGGLPLGRRTKDRVEGVAKIEVLLEKRDRLR